MKSKYILLLIIIISFLPISFVSAHEEKADRERLEGIITDLTVRIKALEDGSRRTRELMDRDREALNARIRDVHRARSSLVRVLEDEYHPGILRKLMEDERRIRRESRSERVYEYNQKRRRGSGTR